MESHAKNWSRPMRRDIPIVSIALLLCLGAAQGGTPTAAKPDDKQHTTAAKPDDKQRATAPKPDDKPKTDDKQQMRGLDEEVQQIKSDVLHISEELRQLEEKLLYPSGTQVAVFVALAKGDTLRLDAVRLQIDGQ